MGWVSVDLERRIAAPAHRIWKLLTNHEAMPDWFPAREVVRRRAGAPDPNGVGARRVVRISGLALEEHITVWEPERRMAYTVVEGAPFVDHVAELVLTPEGDATRVRWTTRCRPRLPFTGWAVQRMIERTLRAGLDGLARRAEGP